jgi:HEAT repeat protein
MSNAPTPGSLLADLQHPSPLVRQQAALTLSVTPDLTLEEALVSTVVRERDPFVRDTMTRALVRCSDRVIAPLVALLGHPDCRRA